MLSKMKKELADLLVVKEYLDIQLEDVLNKVQKLEEEIYLEENLKLSASKSSRAVIDPDLKPFCDYLENTYVSDNTKKKLAAKTIRDYQVDLQRLDQKIRELYPSMYSGKLYLSDDLVLLNNIYNLLASDAKLSEFNINTSHGSPRAALRVFIAYVNSKLK